MLTLRKMMNVTPSDVIARSRLTTVVIINGVKRIYDDGLETVVFKAKCRAHTETKYYEVVIELYPNEIHQKVFQKPSLDSLAWVSCQCPWFLFNCEYAITKKGSSSIQFCNGKRPVITNPGEIPWLCKHLYAASPDVVKEAARIASSDKKYRYTTSR